MSAAGSRFYGQNFRLEGCVELFAAHDVPSERRGWNLGSCDRVGDGDAAAAAARDDGGDGGVEGGDAAAAAAAAALRE